MGVSHRIKVVLNQKVLEKMAFWAFLEPKNLRNAYHIKTLNWANNKRYQKFKGSFRVLRGIFQGVCFYANSSSITCRENVWLKIFFGPLLLEIVGGNICPPPPEDLVILEGW